MKREGQISVNSKNMFPIIKKWLYSDKDIFLREIVSNSCDAIKKLISLRGIGQAPQEDGYQPRVEVRIDSEKKQLIVSDNGIGMTEDEVERYITQVAFSGAEEFLQKYGEDASEAAGIIGHFGLGFYSSFMVSDTVEIQTLSFQPDAKPVHWTSSGEDSYEIEDGERTEHGTTIIMNITEGEEEFLQESRIREILNKYCQFMPYEIYLNPHDEQRPVYDKDGNVEKNEDGTDKMRTVKPLPVNDTQPLWLKSPSECTDEEYKAFYQKVFMDFNEPLFWIHLNVDYPFNLKGILYFPKQVNRLEVVPGQVKLYSNQVFVADNIKEVIPEFLLLLKGVIDCPDMPLNVSRSFLQNDGQVQKIAQHITKKVSDKLHQIFKNDRETYEKYWNDISAFIKFGCLKDEKFYDRMKDILLLHTIDGEYKTLEEYPKADENKIYMCYPPHVGRYESLRLIQALANVFEKGEKNARTM
jgi:molecular chaperone HtpG